MKQESIKILLIEDNPGDARLIQEMLKDANGNGQTSSPFHLTHRDQLRNGMAYLDKNHADLLLLDLGLPDSRGLETLIKAHTRAPQVPIIVLTGLDDKGLAVEAVRTGGQSYLVKGQMDSHLLVRTIRYAIERHCLRLKLKDSQRRLSTIVQNNADGILVIDRKGMIRFANRAAEGIFGRTAAKLLGYPFGAPVVGGESAEIEIPHPQNGKTIIAEIRVTQTRWARQPVYLTSLRDITSRKQIEESLRHSETLKSAILESALDCIITIDQEGKIIEFNPAAEKTFGYTRAQALGQKVVELIGHPAMHQEYSKTLADYISLESGLLLGERIEAIATNANGNEIPIELAITPVPLEKSKVFAIFLRDITERKRTKQAEKELMQMKDDLIANVSHQLRTPLSSIKGFLELLLKGKVNDPAIQEEFLTRAMEDAEHLLSLVNYLLNISRLEADQLQMETESIDLNSLIPAVLQRLKGLAAKKEIPLSFEPLSQPLMIEADPHWLQQVLINLVGNAIKFSEVYHPVKVTVQKENGHMMVKVIDQGPGIPEESIPKLFNKFYQAESAMKRAGKGTGMGLYLSKEIVEAHGGQIGIKSKLGEGSIFYFTLPVQKEEST